MDTKQTRLVYFLLQLLYFTFFLRLCNSQGLKVNLTEGSDAYHGRFTIHWYGTMGYVCNRNINTRTATALCGLIGYQGGEISVVGYSRHGLDPSQIFMGSVNCPRGVITDLFQCTIDYNTQCSPSTILGLSCGPTKAGTKPGDSVTTTKEADTTTETSSVVTSTEDNNLFIADVGQKGIYSLDLSSNEQELVPGTSETNIWPTVLAYNENWDELYYSVRGSNLATIVRFNMKTKEKHTLVLQEEDHSLLSGFAFDPISNLLFFSDEKLSSIYVMTADLKWVFLVNSELQKPSGIAIHPLQGLLFWADSGLTPHIGRSSMAGTSQSIIIRSDIKSPKAITADILEDMIYWYDSGLDKIERCDLSGGSRSVMVRPGQFMFDFAVDENYLYMSSRVENGSENFPMYRLHKERGEMEPIGISTSSYRPNGLALNKASLSEKFTELSGQSNPCAGKGKPCGNLPFCLARVDFRAECWCPQGYLSSDGSVNGTCKRNYTLSLEGGPNSYSGRVIVDFLGHRGTICQRSFYGIPEAKVICRTLGLGASVASLQYYKGSTSLPFWLDRLDCTGEEKELGHCIHSPWGVIHPNCSPSQEMGVICGKPEYGVQLADGPDEMHGRIELTINGERGTVCDDEFGLSDAKVICRMLGYNGPSSGISLHYYGPGRGEIFLDDVACTGEEENIGFCKHGGVSIHDCVHDEDVGIHCGRLPLSVRLEGGPDALHGRVVLSVGGREGSVCNRGDPKMVQVFCRMLNYLGSDISAQTYDGRKGQIWLEQVACSGREFSIDQCQHHGWGYLHVGCTHDYDLGINCGTPYNLTVRLVDGPDYLHGRVEVSNWGRVGSVCDDSFGFADALVICRMLGYRGRPGINVNRDYPSAPADLHIWLDDLGCRGSETDLGSCPHNGWGIHNCQHEEDVGVDCGPILTPRVTFVRDGKPDPYFGTVIVSDGQVKETLCFLGVSHSTAKVICRMAGYTGPYVSLQNYTYSGYPMASHAYDCQGTETNLNRCQIVTGRTCGDTPMPAGVNCGVPGDISARLEGGISNFHGRVQVTYQGQQSAICDRYFGNREAEVICRMIGYTGPADDIELRWYGPGFGSIIETIRCLGNESSIQQCSHILWHYNFTLCPFHYEDIGLHCGPEPRPGNVRVRLEGGFDDLHGRVILTVNDVDGTICDASSNYGTRQDDVARTICNMLGYKGRDVEAWKIGKETLIGSKRHWLDIPRCLGVDDIADCLHRGWGVHIFLPSPCDHSHDVAVNCGQVPDTRIAVELVNGWDRFHGRVSVTYQGITGSVCFDDLSEAEAQVICRMIGYRGSDVGVSSIYSRDAGIVLLDDLKCSINASHISSCRHRGWGVSFNNCGRGGQAGVNCGPLITPDLSMDLLGGKDRLHGRATLLVKESSFNGSICDTRPLGPLQTNIAKVICHMQGYTQSDVEAWLCPADSVDVLRDINCLGSENHINECLQPGDLRTVSVGCDRNRHLCVSCGLSKDDFKVWTRGGIDHLHGQVLVSYHGNLNGTICATGFGDNEAKVVCRMMGYEGSGVSATVRYGAAPDQFNIVVGLSCSGTEQHLGECSHRGVAVYTKDCSDNSVVGVHCGPYGGPITLPGAEVCGVRAVQKIAGGDPVSRGEWPWQISLQNVRGVNLCGGSIIAPEWIVTAAHCVSPRRAAEAVNNPGSVTVVVGASNTFLNDGTAYNISKVIRHPLYDPFRPKVNASSPFDVAVVKLNKKLTFNAEVSPICLKAPRGIVPKGPCYATGWGKYHSGGNAPDTLREVLLPVVRESLCISVFGSLFHSTSHLCAGYRSSRGDRNVCSGDSGGPLACRHGSIYYLYGTVVGGFLCGTPGVPHYAIFSDIATFSKWIEYQVTNN